MSSRLSIETYVDAIQLTRFYAWSKIAKDTHRTQGDEMTGDEIREQFLLFFEEKGHKRIQSSSLIPEGDPTLLLTNAGMVQFKPYFMGEAIPPSTRLTSCQKCFRTTDIASVGNLKHLTFFEMLGNFSVGDYFKKEAISWSWEFVRQWLKIPEEKLWITIFLDDDEAFGYWRDLGIRAERIVRCGEEDNFWGPAGEMGPCGPCSEIHYDFGEEVGCQKTDCSPSCDCGRFLEIWNLVFMQYYQDIDGKRTPLPRKNIDTGMGLERVTAVLQGTRSPYDTNLFAPIIQKVCELTGHRYGDDEKTDRAIRIVAEHARSVTLLTADGVTPSNEGRGYVLRRILRRATAFGRILGLERSFLNDIAVIVIQRMGGIYPELRENEKRIRKILGAEEARFGETLNTGLNLLNQIIKDTKKSGKELILGQDVFRLYDTYGFPSELTLELAADNGLSVDMKGFEAEMEKQREKARAAHKFMLGDREPAVDYASMSLTPTQFVGYEKTKSKSRIIALAVEGKTKNVAGEEQQVEVVLENTPFYAEMGGQVADIGIIASRRGNVAIHDTVMASGGIVVHIGKVHSGTISIGDRVMATVDKDRRLDIARNHTATHLLHAALRSVLGDDVHQAGSLVAPDYFRFDFTQEVPVLPEELDEIQNRVNRTIRRNLTVAKQEMPYKEAVASGAIALFGEKYGDKVRTVRVGSAKLPVSFEVCGGTHVNRTGDIGVFHITSEGSIGSGMRRIEAVTGRGAEKLLEERSKTLERIAHRLQVPSSDVENKFKNLLEELNSERNRVVALERQLSRDSVDSLLSQVRSVNGVSILAAQVTASNYDAMRHIGDLLREKIGSGVILLAAIWDDRPNFLAMVTSDLVGRGFSAGDIVKRAAQVTGGGGGGKPQMAQGGGKDVAKIDQALKSAVKMVEEKA